MKPSADEFCFMVQLADQPEQSEKASLQLNQDWDKLKGSPVESVVSKYKDTVFRMELPNRPPHRTVDIEVVVELVDNVPVTRIQYHLSDEMKRTIREWTREMPDAGIIRPSKSPYSSPIFCVKKAVCWRIVHDFRAINSKIRIPVRLRQSDIPYNAFSTPDGQFEYLVTSMGLSCSLAAFNRMIQRVFCDQKAFCQAYFDDLFVFTKSKDIADHLETLDAVLQRCQEQKIYIKLAECTFCSHEVPCQGDYLGATVSAWIPIRFALYTTGRRQRRNASSNRFWFCESYAETSAPLIEARKGKTALERINLTLEQGKCFAKLKAHLTSPPVLAHPDSRRYFYVQMGASDYAVGGYLYQLDSGAKEKVIAYSGKKLSSAELMYPTREKECWSCWPHYTRCKSGECTLSTNRSSLTLIIGRCSRF
ncbi:reverse transcriptase [Phytophthora megakarya]|uniref:Reverse transcriptase n=1 Tax=Phytophthora megakarya TaxID=4795 RepID=A0A225US17_9STRA|nr:reverse transcriptase [Phytophthora megakarya]